MNLALTLLVRLILQAGDAKGEAVEPPPRINPPVGLPGDELDISTLAARRRVLRLAKKGPHPAASGDVTDATSKPRSVATSEQTVTAMPPSRKVQGTAMVDIRARVLRAVADAERPLMSTGPAPAAQPAAERSDNGAGAAMEADLPGASAANEALSELPKDAAESVIVAEEQRSSFKRQQAAAAAAAQQAPAAAEPSAAVAALSSGNGSLAKERRADDGRGAGAADLVVAEPRLPLGRVRTKIGADGWLQSRLAELEHKVDSLSQAAADAGGPPFASLLLPYGGGIGSTPSAVPAAPGSESASPAADGDSGYAAPTVPAEGADDHRSVLTRHEGALPASPGEAEGSLTAHGEADAEAAAAGDSSVVVADADATSQPKGSVDDAAAGASHDFLRPVRRITGAVPAFLWRRWQQTQHGEGAPAAQLLAPTSQEAASGAALPQHLAAKLGEVCLSAAPHEALLPEAPKHARAVLGPLRRVRPQTVAASQPPRSRSARIDVATMSAVEQHAGPVRLQQFRLGPPQQDRPQLALPAPAVTQRLAMEPAWGEHAPPESPPKFSRQRCGHHCRIHCVLRETLCKWRDCSVVKRTICEGPRVLRKHEHIKSKERQ